MTDKLRQVIADAAHGDPAAFERLVAWGGGRLLVYTEARLGAPLRAVTTPEDLVQEAWLEVWRSLPSLEYRDPRSFAHWLCRVVENRIRDAGERETALKRRPPGDRLPLSDLADRIARASAGPATRAGARERWQHLGEALRQLDVDTRSALVLRHLADLGVDEIAVRLGKSPTTVRRLLSEGTGRVGRLMEGSG